ncbi:MAG: recombinase family protein [Planctomycetes bacterium]|nr:recombinase family protein [Planctomycetota bacterium]
MSTQPKSTGPKNRCAIYTRKSCEEGLELEFNSLHAQRESAEAFIASQQHEGWECLPDRYDDGGFSGGSLERPALNRLLEDIKTGRIDCVVVYKVDRLSRSLLDFSRIMETFDKHGVSFVSVTQQFNTTHSMGRLTLNILLSFAQFEREIIGERIRDKIAAQRRKGKWAGGVPILGYDVDRSNTSPKLVINAEEAVMVRRIFSLYQELGSLLPVVNEVNKRVWQNKVWKTKKGLTRGGKAFDKCSIYSLLTNPLYAGLIRHKDLLHKGEHENLIAPEVFEAVQKQLKQNGRGQGNHLINKHGALLKGLLHCSACDRAMVHTFTQKDEKLYRYYTCTNVIKNGRGKCPSPHLPAGEIEKAVIEQIRAIGADFEIQNQVAAQMKEGQTKRLEELQTNRRQLERQLSRDHAEIGKLAVLNDPTGATSARIADLHVRITKCESDLSRVVAAVTELERSVTEKAEIAETVLNFESIWEALNSREKSRLIRLMVSRIEFNAKDTSISVTFYPEAIRSIKVKRKDDAA